jgi:hypothetical protein
MSIELPATKVTIDVKEAILKILENSAGSYASWLNCDHGHGYVREMNSNNMAIKAILESTQSK